MNYNIEVYTKSVCFYFCYKYYFLSLYIALNKGVLMDNENKNKRIILEVALILNKELFDENKISYKMFKYTEDNILKELKIFT